MDDHELEARLRVRLHERFDAATSPPELIAGVRQAIDAAPRPVGFGALRPGRLTLGRAPVALAALVTVILITGIGIGSVVVPGHLRPTPTPGATPLATADRWFLTLPGFEITPARADIEAATDVVVGRLQALGIQPIVERVDPGIAIKVPPGGATDAAIREVLGAVGDVAFVPLPPEDYGEFGEGRFKAVVGEPLPTDPPALFGWDGIGSIGFGDAEGSAGDGPPPLLFTLNDRGKAAFALWSQSHVGEMIAILVDGRVALLPTVNEPIPGGEILISPGIDDRARFDETAAILIGGRLPPAFGEATAPALVAVEDVIAATQRELPDANPLIWDLDAIALEGHWVPVWEVTFGGRFSPDCTPGILGPTCVVYARLIATFDASNGVPIERAWQDRQ